MQKLVCTCDRCGHEQEGFTREEYRAGSRNFFTVSVNLNGPHRSRYVSNHLLPVSAEWCETCCLRTNAAHPLTVPKGQEARPTPSLENMIREIAREAMSEGLE